MSDVRRTLLRLALAACDRGDALGAHALILAVLAAPDERQCAVGAPAAESYGAFGRRVGKSGRTVREMVRDGRIPRAAVIGLGRGRRVLVVDALAALARDAPPSSAEQAGEAYVARRPLRIVRGAP